MSVKMIVGLSVALVAVVGLAVVGCRVTRAGYESAPYKVVLTDGKFELRDYPAMTVVETSMRPAGGGSDGSFTRLFRYITGQNQAQQKIPMTTPVYMSGGATNATMAFVMPATMKSSQVPKPADGAVTVKELEPGRFAVLRFSGGRTAENETQALDRLRTWLTGQGIKPGSEPIYGYFDPPWTPSFLRRNEVMLRTAAER